MEKPLHKNTRNLSATTSPHKSKPNAWPSVELIPNISAGTASCYCWVTDDEIARHTFGVGGRAGVRAGAAGRPRGVVEGGRRGGEKGTAQDGGGQAAVDLRLGAEGRQTRRGDQGPGQAHHARRRGAGQQAGGKNHPAADRARQDSRRGQAAAADDPRPLVLAIFSREPLPLPAAHRHRAAARRRFHDVGSAPALPRDRSALHQRPRRWTA